MRLNWALLPFLVVMQVPSARAQPAAGGELVEAGRKVIEEASQAAAKKDWATCRTKAAGVWDAVKNFKVAGLLGSCELELGMYAEAADHLDFYLKHDDKSDAKRTQGVQARYERALKEVALVDVSCDAADAAILVGGKPVGPAPRTLHLAPGAQTFSADKAGYLAEPQTISLAKGEKRTLTLVLRKIETAPAPSASAAPTTTVAPPSSSSAPIEPLPSGKSPWPAVALFGAAAVGAGVGIGLFVAGAGSHSDAEDVSSRCGRTASCRNEGQALLDDADGMKTGAAIAFSVGGAAALAGILYLAIPSSGDAETGLKIVPLVSPTFGGAQVQTSF